MRSRAGTAEPPRERPACRMLPPREGGERVPSARAPGRLSRLIPAGGGGCGATAAGLSPPDRGSKMPRAGGPIKRAKGASLLIL